VLGDADAPSRALRNLVDNAVTAAGEGGRVRVRTDHDGAHVLASVEDDGPGGPAAERERIFEGFVRLEPLRGPGAGLGLAIARRVARQHGGDLTYAGGGQGARFVLRLPAAAGTRARLRRRRRREPRLRGSTQPPSAAVLEVPAHSGVAAGGRCGGTRGPEHHAPLR
jgi:K+-sensing histidine kinase KdpD